MKSNQNHINPPLKKDLLDLPHCPYKYSVHPTVLTRKEYDALVHKDPITIYTILERDGSMVQCLGDVQLSRGTSIPQFVMGLEGNVYTIYQLTGVNGSTRVDPIHSYSDINSAIKELSRLRNVGSNEEVAYKIYLTLASYIEKIHGIHETITLLIAQMGYRDDPSLQYLNERAIAYGTKLTDRDLPLMFRNDIRAGMLREHSFLGTLYANIYDVFILYDFFKGDKYKDVAEDELDLADVVSNILACQYKCG